jgi:type IV fimbrial biogenesis protein FimT
MLARNTPEPKLRVNHAGFTLIEIMIVVAIISIASAMAAPNLVMMYARYELYQTTTSLYNRLVFARSAAISRNAMIVATPSNLPGGGSQVLFTNPLGIETMSPKVQFVLPLPVQPIGFTPRGLSTTTLATQTIQLQSVRDPNLVYTISLAPSGKVTWCPVQITPCVRT